MIDAMDNDGAPIDPKKIADRYVALWNEPDPNVRRKIIRGLWAPSGEHVLDPPQDIRKTAHDLGFDWPVLEIRGYGAIETRATRAYESFIAPGKHQFRLRDDAARLRNVVKFHWEMVSTSTGEVEGVGLELLILDDEGRIAVDYQFIES
jgi:hypothetical protein